MASFLAVHRPGRRERVSAGGAQRVSHGEREVLTAAGAVTVRAPRVNDKRVDPETGERQRFSSAILPAWVRKSPQMTEVLPLLYLHDFPAATSRRPSSSSWAPPPGCRRRRSPG